MTRDSDQHREVARLEALQETGLLGPEARPELDAIVLEAKEHFNVPIALVTLLDRDTQLLKARIGVDLTEMPRRLAFCNYTIQADDVFVVPDTLEDPRFASHPMVLGEPFLRFYAGAPLIYLDGIRLGALCLLDKVPRQFSAGDRSELAGMADRVITSIALHEFAKR